MFVVHQDLPDLVWHVDFNAEFFSKCEDDTRVLLEETADHDNVKTFLEKLVCQLASVNATDSADSHLVTDCLLDCLTERCLVSRSCVRVLLGVVTTRADIHQVNATLSKDLSKLNGLLRSPALLDLCDLLKPLGSADSDKEGHGLGDDFSNEVDSLEKQSSSVLEASTILVSTLVRSGRQERA